MRRAFLLTFFTIFNCAVFNDGVWADDFCKREALDPEFPAGLVGAYEVIGKDPTSASAYAGTLVIGYGKNAYLLTRTVRGRSVNGEAWIEKCGIDKFVVLKARYYGGTAIEMGCSLGMDGDNYNRATCVAQQAGGKRSGLESWFQKR